LLGCGGAQTPDANAPQAGQEVDVAAGGQDGASAEAVEGSAANHKAISPAAAEAYAAGLQAFKDADLKGAAQQFDRALQLDPRAPEVHVAVGMVRERSGETSGALESYAAALRLVPSFGPAVDARVSLLLTMGRAGEAETFAREVLTREPDSAAALAALAEVRSERGDSTSAQELAQKALKKDPDYKPAMVTLARDHYRARRLDLALYTLKAILDGYGQENPPRDKNNASARFLRALIFKEQGRRKAAMEELSTVISLRPDLVEARLHLAAYMLEAGNAEEGRPLLEEALKYEPSNVLVHLNLGDAYRLLGKPQDALDHLTWVARKEASLSQVHYNLGLLYLFAAKVPGLTDEQAVDHAIESFEQFKKLEPRAARGFGDDVEELIARARNKKSIMEALREEPAEADDMGDGAEDADMEEEG
jgi:tetratricopeptide (TPR) repeat protein